MNPRTFLSFAVVAFVALCASPALKATSNYKYKADEYVVIAEGRAPNGLYSIAAHGEGDLGDENFRLYLMNAQAGKVISPLEGVADPLDTGADAFHAKWSANSRQVSITYRVDRNRSVTVRFRIDDGRATLITAPTKSAGGG